MAEVGGGRVRWDAWRRRRSPRARSLMSKVIGAGAFVRALCIRDDRRAALADDGGATFGRALPSPVETNDAATMVTGEIPPGRRRRMI
jgi:hypothetical protein